jgi:hypothetical protein
VYGPPLNTHCTTLDVPAAVPHLHRHLDPPRWRAEPLRVTRRAAARCGAVLTRRIENPFLPQIDSGFWAITAKHW